MGISIYGLLCEFKYEIGHHIHEGPGSGTNSILISPDMLYYKSFIRAYYNLNGWSFDEDCFGFHHVIIFDKNGNVRRCDCSLSPMFLYYLVTHKDGPYMDDSFPKLKEVLEKIDEGSPKKEKLIRDERFRTKYII